MNMKPILFNTDMVRGLLDNRYVRETWQEVYETEHDADGSKRTVNIRDLISNFDDIPKVEAGISHDCATAIMEPRMKYYVFKASDIKYADPMNGLIWRPSIHMPREAARIFLRVTDVSACRVQDITDEDARKEGCRDREDFRRVWNECYAKPRPVKDEDGIIDHYESYPWENIHEIRTYRGKPLYVIGNPWVWVIEFERISKEEAQHGDE